MTISIVDTIVSQYYLHSNMKPINENVTFLSCVSLNLSINSCKQSQCHLNRWICVSPPGTQIYVSVYQTDKHAALEIRIYVTSNLSTYSQGMELLMQLWKTKTVIVRSQLTASMSGKKKKKKRQMAIFLFFCFPGFSCCIRCFKANLHILELMHIFYQYILNRVFWKLQKTKQNKTQFCDKTCYTIKNPVNHSSEINSHNTPSINRKNTLYNKKKYMKQEQ